MMSLIMLGQIPGTSLQITFWGWLLTASFLLGLYIIWQRDRCEQLIWTLLISLSLLVTTHQRNKRRQLFERIAL